MNEATQLLAVICLLIAVPLAFFAVAKIVAAILGKDEDHPAAFEVAHTLAQAVKILAFALLITLVGLFFAEPSEAFDFIVEIWKGAPDVDREGVDPEKIGGE